MYNRYIPQPDGSYRRRTVPDPKPAPPPPPPAEPCEPEPEPQPQCQNIRRPRQTHDHGRQRYHQKKPQISQKEDHSDGFLRQLLPKNIDTGDLLVIALLLLMAGDCEEDKSTALLTLALYLFM